MYHYGHMGFFPEGDWLFLIVLVVLAVLAVMFFCKWKNSSCQMYREDNLEILRNRLARGEINQEEFEKLKAVLAAKA